jgi:hypothetical protein
VHGLASVDTQEAVLAAVEGWISSRFGTVPATGS